MTNIDCSMENIIDTKCSYHNIPDELPIAQKCLRIGFKKITISDMRERFCLAAINRDEFKKTPLYKKLANRIIEKYIVRWEYYPSSGKTFCGISFSFYDKFLFINRKIDMFEYLENFCDVNIESLNEYISGIIPDRCLESIRIARKIGLENFYVCYPKMYNTTILKDPIIIAKITNDLWVEIDCWE